MLYHEKLIDLWHVLTRDHTVLPANHTFIHKWHEPNTCLYSPAAERHRTLTGTHFPSRWGYKAELSWVAGHKPRWFTLPQTVTHFPFDTSSILPRRTGIYSRFYYGPHWGPGDAVGRLCAYVRTKTLEENDLWRKYLARRFVPILTTSSSRVTSWIKVQFRRKTFLFWGKSGSESWKSSSVSATSSGGFSSFQKLFFVNSLFCCCKLSCTYRQLLNTRSLQLAVESHHGQLVASWLTVGLQLTLSSFANERRWSYSFTGRPNVTRRCPKSDGGAISRTRYF